MKQNVLGPIRDFKWYSLPKIDFVINVDIKFMQLVFSAVTCSKEKNITVNYQRFWNNLYLICFSSLHAISNKVHVFNDIYTFQIRMCNPRACEWISRWQMTDRDRFLKSHLQATQLSPVCFQSNKRMPNLDVRTVTTQWTATGVGSGGGGGYRGGIVPTYNFYSDQERHVQLRVRVNFRLCTMFK